jgi:hypothetical protein
MSAFLSIQNAYNSFELILLILFVFLSGFKSCKYLNMFELFEFGSSATNFSNLAKFALLYDSGSFSIELERNLRKLLRVWSDLGVFSINWGMLVLVNLTILFKIA